MTRFTPGEEEYTHFTCPNPFCELFNQPGSSNIVHRSWTGKDKGIERLRCRECGKEFSQREGTLMARGKLPEETVERMLKCQRWGVCDAGSADICGVNIKTVHRFQTLSANRAKVHHQQVVHQIDVDGVQLDEAHSKRRPGKVEWIHTALAMGSLFVLWVAFGPRDTHTATYLIAQVVARVQRLPLFLTDCWKAYPKALVQVLGRVYRPRRKGNVGRKPKPRLVAPDHLFYAQVVKIRDSAGQVIQVTTRVVFGGSRRFLKVLFHNGLGTTIQTAFMERWYGTLRGLVAPLRRRTRCLSWSAPRHQGRIWLIISLYNFVIPHKSLQKGRKKRTPAMVIGLADRVWSYRDYIWLPVHCDKDHLQAMDEHVHNLMQSVCADAKIEITPAPAHRPKKVRKIPLKKAA